MSEPKSLSEFISASTQKEGKEKFQLESSRMLEINVSGDVWAKLGSMIAYRGQIKFSRERAFEHGLGRFFKKFVSGEAAPLMKVSGHGSVYLADSGKHITLIKLQNESIYVNGNDLLAF